MWLQNRHFCARNVGTYISVLLTVNGVNTESILPGNESETPGLVDPKEINLQISQS